MFVIGNEFSDVKSYFQEKLNAIFSEREVKSILKDTVCNRLDNSNLSYIDLLPLRFSESDLLYFRSVIKRLLNNEPFQHVIGYTWFCDVKIKCDERALIPRPETEELVVWVVEQLDDCKNLRIVDLCAGTGCIGIALKTQLSAANITLVEYSQDAIGLLNDNLKENKMDLPVVELDVLNSSDYNFPLNSFDCWVSNPPYIPTIDKLKMHENVLNFEPEMALFVPDEDPLLFYREIAKNGLLFLKNEGLLFFEIHEDLGQETMALLNELGFVNIELRKDLQGKDRMIKAQKLNS